MVATTLYLAATNSLLSVMTGGTDPADPETDSLRAEQVLQVRLKTGLQFSTDFQQVRKLSTECMF